MSLPISSIPQQSIVSAVSSESILVSVRKKLMSGGNESQPAGTSNDSDIRDKCQGFLTAFHDVGGPSPVALNVYSGFLGLCTSLGFKCYDSRQGRLMLCQEQAEEFVN